MSHHERTDPEASFDLPDKVTVRQQLAYYGASVSTRDNDAWLVRYWNGAKQLIQNWKCELIPDKDFNLDEATDPKVTNVIIWAGLQVKNHLDSLEDLPKNS